MLRRQHATLFTLLAAVLVALALSGNVAAQQAPTPVPAAAPQGGTQREPQEMYTPGGSASSDAVRLTKRYNAFRITDPNNTIGAENSIGFYARTVGEDNPFKVYIDLNGDNLPSENEQIKVERSAQRNQVSIEKLAIGQLVFIDSPGALNVFFNSQFEARFTAQVYEFESITIGAASTATPTSTPSATPTASATPTNTNTPTRTNTPTTAPTNTNTPATATAAPANADTNTAPTAVAPANADTNTAPTAVAPALPPPAEPTAETDGSTQPVNTNTTLPGWVMPTMIGGGVLILILIILVVLQARRANPRTPPTNNP